MPADKQVLLEQSKVFCMAPWVHLFINPDSQVLPCCVADHERPVGSLREQSLLELWNAEPMRRLRRNMLSEARSAECRRCYEDEASGITGSPRYYFNLRFGRHWEMVEATSEQGELKSLNLAHWDFRFSNLCNFRCRPCAPSFSSAWYEDATQLPAPWTQPPIVPKVRTAAATFSDLWSQLEGQVERLDSIYFAGGEPLFMDEHAFLLKELVARGRTDVQLRYSSNLSRLTHAGIDFPDLWRQFKSVTIAASIDGFGARGEYLRKGLVWDTFVANWREIRRRAPRVFIVASPTVYLLNILHIPDLHRELLQLNLMKQASDFSLNLLQAPRYLTVQALPPALKQEARRRFEIHCREVVSRNKEPEHIESQLRSFEGVLAHMDDADATDRLPEFMEVTRTLDRLRGEKCEEVFPELASLFETAA